MILKSSIENKIIDNSAYLKHARSVRAYDMAMKQTESPI